MRILVLFILLSTSVFSQRLNGNPAVKKVIFQGNSLFDTNVNHTINGLKYVTLGIYNELRTSYRTLSFFDYSISGQDQIQINALLSSQLDSVKVNPQDVYVIWEQTNNLSHYPSKSGAQAFTDLQVTINKISRYTDKWIVCTTIARDLAGDPVNLMTRIDSCNVLIRNNYTGNHLCDLGAHSFFNSRAKASVSPPYDTDKLHLFQLGQDTVIQVVKRAIIKVL